MFTSHRIPYRQSGTLNKLVLAYLEKERSVSELYNYFPDEKGFSEFLKTNPYPSLERSTLVQILEAQASSVKNSSSQQLSNIRLLADKNTYSVTTGHQLCLFTGPLYFIYKIFTTINLAEKLKEQHPKKNFVPVYWMASEDHDFEEVNHFFVNGKKLEWHSDQKGAVGRMSTKGLDEVLKLFAGELGDSKHAKSLTNLFRQSYLEHKDLSTASRFLINELFGQYGIVVLDADDKKLKGGFRTIVERDIFEGKTEKAISDTIDLLTKNKWPVQVHPRPINSFYLDENVRGRFEKDNDRFRVHDSTISFTKTEIQQLIAESPEKLSPNVVLRPLYQQVILPNIAYVGGPGELSYWLEFKEMFREMEVVFPILVPRNFFTIIDKPTAQRAKKLKIEHSGLFVPEQQLLNNLLKNSGKNFETKEYSVQLRELYKQLKESISHIDPTLANATEAELKRSLRGLERLEAKGNRAIRRKAEEETRQIREIRKRLFPDNIPQERRDNFSEYYLRFGPGLFGTIKSEADPFDREHIILQESQDPA